MASLAAAWKGIKPHVPLIKFRKGGHSRLGETFKQEVPVSKMVEPSKHSVVKKPTLEEWQVPANYYRPSLTEEEIEYINRGGPA